MIGEWFKSLSNPSDKVINLRGEIMKLKPEYLTTLNDLMDQVVTDRSDLEILPVGGYSPYGFHIKLKGQIIADRFDVYAMIIPLKRTGIRARARRRPHSSWQRKIVDGQRLFEKIITSSEDIERFITYCKGLH